MHLSLKLFALAAFASFAGLSTLTAGGSFRTEDKLPILKQDEALYNYVMSTLELNTGGWAIRIGSRVNEELGGLRIPPYTILARPKGSTGSWTFWLDIEAEIIFQDAQGNEVPLDKASGVKSEKLTGVHIRPISAEDLARLNAAPADTP